MSSTRLTIRDLTQEVEIFYTEDGEEKSRVFTLIEHSRDDLETFVDLQFAAGEEVLAAAKATKVSEEESRSIVLSSHHLVHDPYYKVVAFCLRHPADGDAPSAEWCKRFVARHKAEAVIQAQEKLDGLDDPEKKAESIRAVMLAAHQARLTRERGSQSTTELQAATT